MKKNLGFLPWERPWFSKNFHLCYLYVFDIIKDVYVLIRTLVNLSRHKLLFLAGPKMSISSTESKCFFTLPELPVPKAVEEGVTFISLHWLQRGYILNYLHIKRGSYAVHFYNSYSNINFAYMQVLAQSISFRWTNCYRFV